jgi:serine/threonine protein kinase
MGEVHLAKTATASLVAVKFIKSEFAGDLQMRERFMAEVDHLRMVSSSRVARFEGADLHHDPPWLAVEYVPGATLRDHVQRVGPIPADLAAMLGAVLAEGLVAIHQVNLVHRDLKPANVIMSSRGPVIIDFGLAKLTDRGEHLTETGVGVGTLPYMPPEQVRGDRDLDGKADVYALGATLVYALTGHSIFPAKPWYALTQLIMDPDTHPDISGVPASLAGIIGSMLAYDPTDRPSAETVMNHLVAVINRSGEDATTVRRRLTELTYVPPEIPLPSDVDDPERDPEDPYDFDTGPTELVPTPAAPAPPPPQPDVDVGWLLADLRTRYGKGTDL